MTTLRMNTLALCAPIIIASFALLTACTPEDKTPPAAPIIDVIPSPTSSSAQRLAGTAEFGSTVTVTGAGPEVQIVADPYTAKWFADIVLTPGDQTISATATDAAGNISAASTLTVNYLEPGNPATVTITGAASTEAGVTQPFEVHVFDDFGDEILDAAYTISTDASAGSTTLESPTSIAFCELGNTVVSVQVGDSGPSADFSIAVTEGAASTLNLVLDTNAVKAGETVAYTTEVLDSCANVTSDVVSIRTNAPGAVAAVGTISGLVRSGSYTVVAEVVNTNAVDSEPLVVDPDESTAIVVLQLASTSALVGVPVGYTVSAVDGFGNGLDKSTLAITTTDATPATIDTVTQTVTFQTVGTPNHIITATLFGNTATETSDAESVLVRNPDVGPPSVTITSPLGATIVAPNNLILVTVSLSDDHGLAQVFLQSTGAKQDFQQQLIPNNPGTGLPETGPVTATFLIKLGRNAIGDLRFVAQAVDTSGNYSSSTAVTVTVDPSILITTPGGVTVSTVAASTLIKQPKGVTEDAAGNIYVTNDDPQVPLIVKIDPNGSFLTNQSIFLSNQPNGVKGEDVLFYDAPLVGDPDFFFVTTRGGNGGNQDSVYRVDSTGLVLNSSFTNVGGKPLGMLLEGRDLSVYFDNKEIHRFNPAALAGNNAPLASTKINPIKKAWGLELIQPGCKANEFQCTGGATACILNTSLCDGFQNCSDNSDEDPATTCAIVPIVPPTIPPTSTLEYRCPGSATTIAPILVCNGVSNCPSGTDELNCHIYAVADLGDKDEVSTFYDNGLGNAIGKTVLANNNNQRQPVDIVITPTGRFAYVTSAKDKLIFQIDLNAAPCGNNCPVVASGFKEPWGLYLEPVSGDLIVTDRGNDAVFRLTGLAQ